MTAYHGGLDEVVGEVDGRDCVGISKSTELPQVEVVVVLTTAPGLQGRPTAPGCRAGAAFYGGKHTY